MSSPSVKISLWSNNSALESFLCQSSIPEFSFGKYEEKNKYLCFLIDTESDMKSVSQSLIDHYLKARENNSKLVIVILGALEKDTEKYLYFKKLLQDIGSQNPIHRLVFCHDLFLLDRVPEGLTSLDQEILVVVREKVFEVSKKGNYYYYPLLLGDFISAFKKILFQNYSRGETYFLQGDPVSDLDLAYLINSASQEFLGFDIDINAVRDSGINSHQEFKKNFLETQSNLNWHPTGDFGSSLKDFIKTTKNSTDESSLPTPAQKGILYKLSKKLHSFHHKFKENSLQEFALNKTKQGIEKIVALSLMFYLVVSLTFFYTSYKTLVSMEKSLFYLRKGSFELSVSSLEAAKKFYSVSNYNYSVLSPVIGLINGGFDKTNQNFLSFVSFSLNSLENVQQIHSLGNKVYLSFNSSGNQQNYQDLALALKSNLQQTYESVNQIEILLNEGNLPSILLQKIKQNIEYQNLKTAQEQLVQVSKIIDIIPVAFDQNQAKNIFVIFQNSLEQRPTGGAIDYVQQISLEGGRVVFQHLYTSQEIDKKDEFTVPAPPLVEKLSGEADWKLRDMNYNPDYPQTSTNLAWYFEKKLKIKPDLIISIDRSFIESYLKNVGDLVVGDSSIGIEKFQQSEDSSGLLAKSVFEALINHLLEHKPSIISLIQVTYQSIEDNHLLVWTSDTNVEKNILGQSFAGAVRSYSCHSGVSSSRDCIAQTSHINFSNFSLLPVNSYLKHRTTHKVSLNNQGVDHLYDIQYEYLKQPPLANRNLTEIVQLYIPIGSKINSITLNGEEYSLNQLVFQQEPTLDRYQFIISTLLGQKSNLQISYSVIEEKNIVLPIAFSFTEISQGKHGADLIKLDFSIPESSRVSAITNKAESTLDRINYEFPAKTSTFGLNLVPKLQ